MSLYKLDLSVISQAQVRATLNEMKQSGLTRGIYLWINSQNGKFYVGSTLNFDTRILSYFYLTGAYGILLNAFNKYGFNVFTLVLIAIPDPSKELVLELEQYVLDTFSPEYNIQPFANSSAGRILTSEHKAKIGKAIGEGLNHHSYNGGIPVYLFKVTSQGLELAATFPNLTFPPDGIPGGKDAEPKKLLIFPVLPSTVI